VSQRRRRAARTVFYVRVALALLGIGLIVAGVLVSSISPGWLTAALIIAGFLLLTGLYLLGHAPEALRVLGIRFNR